MVELRCFKLIDVNSDTSSVAQFYLKNFSIFFQFLLLKSALKVLYSRTEHSKGFSFCFRVNNPLTDFPRTFFNFENKIYFRSEQHAASLACSILS